MTRACIAVLVAILLPGMARASLVHELTPLSELVSRADGVFIGQVIDMRGELLPADNTLHTRVKLEVQSELKGFADPGGHVEILVPGGQVQDRIEILRGAPTFSEGELVLVFVSKRSDRSYEVLDMAQGKYSIQSHDTQANLLATRDLSELYLLAPNGPARLFAAVRGPRDEALLEPLLNLIEAYVAPPGAEAIASTSHMP